MPVSTRPILMIEDNVMDVDLTQRAFARSKVSNPIQVLWDGEEAVTYVDTWEESDALPVVVFLDLKLPKVHGLDVLRHMKAHPQFKKIPVVILTTSREDRDIEAAYDIGVSSYIVKPVSFAKFVEIAAQLEVYWLALNTPPE